MVRDPATPWTFRRGGDGPLYVERRGAGSVGRTPKTREAESNVAGPKKDPAEVVSMRPDLTKPDTAAAPEDLKKLETREPPGDRSDVFRNTPHSSRGLLKDVEPAAPRRLPPKVAGIHRHGPECDCWLCEDEAPAGRVEIGASA